MFKHSYACSPSPDSDNSLSPISLSPISLTQSPSPSLEVKHENDETTEDLENVQLEIESSVDLERESQVCFFLLIYY